MKKEKKTKYIPSMGLAFNEENEMRRLGEMAKEGWIFDSYKMLGYVFKRGEPKKLIYCFDSYRLCKEESEQYFKIFETGGWKHICSVDNYYHFFCAVPGTPAIYTDKSSLIEKYSRLNNMLIKAVVCCGLSGIGFLGLNLLLTKFWHNGTALKISSILAAFSFSAMFAMIITFCATMLRIRKIKSGKKL